MTRPEHFPTIMAEARAKAEWKKLAAVVGFAGRVSGIAKERDAKTEAAVAAALPPRPPSAKHLNPAQRCERAVWWHRYP